ncbi:hypothetical protein QJS10_CPB15g01561 [Acorus calamus]|uniref:Uncharacterized protein n=1 Tax=Acorus calamus TaxID=4465 RepID=A0AAV9D8I9_ACOCL|nr:hypothetical protein QJS10_CPB15g01561 [Acorus calamus]
MLHRSRLELSRSPTSIISKLPHFRSLLMHHGRDEQAETRIGLPSHDERTAGCPASFHSPFPQKHHGGFLFVLPILGEAREERHSPLIQLLCLAA